MAKGGSASFRRLGEIEALRLGKGGSASCRWPSPGVGFCSNGASERSASVILNGPSAPAGRSERSASVWQKGKRFLRSNPNEALRFGERCPGRFVPLAKRAVPAKRFGPAVRRKALRFTGLDWWDEFKKRGSASVSSSGAKRFKPGRWIFQRPTREALPGGWPRSASVRWFRLARKSEFKKKGSASSGRTQTKRFKIWIGGSASLALGRCASPNPYSWTLPRRRALSTTDSELKLMARPASIGDSSRPVNG